MGRAPTSRFDSQKSVRQKLGTYIEPQPAFLVSQNAQPGTVTGPSLNIPDSPRFVRALGFLLDSRVRFLGSFEPILG